MSTKMKGLLKGLRYISQIFENEKEQEIQIGHPTDVKHVAHIGWDGPSTNSAPSWMNEFKASGAGFSSAPLGSGSGDMKEAGSVKWSSEDLTRRGGSVQSCTSPARELPDVPRSSRRQTSTAAGVVTSSGESPRMKSEKSRQSRRSSKGSQSPAREWDQARTSHQTMDPALESSSPARPDNPKKTRRKKSKESSGGGSSRLSTRSKGQSSLVYESPFSDPGPGSGSGSGSLSTAKNSDQFCQALKLEGFERDEKPISRIS